MRQANPHVRIPHVRIPDAIFHSHATLRLGLREFNDTKVKSIFERDRIAMSARSNNRIMLKVNVLLPKNNIRQPIGALLFPPNQGGRT